MWLLFDAVGTLIHPNRPIAEIYHAAGQQFGSGLSVEQIEGRFRAALAAETKTTASALAAVESRPPAGEAAELERWRRIVRQVFQDVPDQQQQPLFELLWDHFAQPANWRLFSDVGPALVKLAAAGQRLGIASNFDGRLRRIVAGLPGLEICERTFLSSEIGYSKPDPRFFTAVERQLGVPGEQITLVGDDWDNDIVAARAAGWQAIWLCREGATGSAAHVRSLDELAGQEK